MSFPADLLQKKGVGGHPLFVVCYILFVHYSYIECAAI